MSSIKEFFCQYTDQIRKKRKSWHDGKLRYSKLDSRFTLFSIEDGQKQIGSTFVTNNKDIETYLSPNGYNIEEHQIFSRFAIIITEAVGEITETEITQPTKIYGKKSIPRVKASFTSKLPNESNKNPLALEMNQPFKPPRKIEQVPLTSFETKNRPSIRLPQKVEKKKTRHKILRVEHHSIQL